MSQDRERRTIFAMVEIFCQAHHARHGQLCDGCQELYDYAMFRLGKCPFGPDKPVCAKCPIHCYRPEMREKIREVMRFSGPRMLLRHPGMALAHMMDKRKPAPERPRRSKASTGTEKPCMECDELRS